MTTATIVGTPTAQSLSDRDGDLRRQLTAFYEQARDQLSLELSPLTADRIQLDQARASITAVAVMAIDELHSARRRSPRVHALVELALRGAELDGKLRTRELRRRSAALVGVESALARLRSIPTTDDLVAAVCPELIRSCGFSRAMLSRVTGTTWRPWMAQFSHRDLRESDEQWMAGGGIALAEMPLESDLLQTLRHGFSSDTSADPRVSRAFVAQTGSRSYAVAPIAPKGRVIGLVHADYFPSPRSVDEVDAHILGAFAEGFGRLYERGVLLERLGRERDHVRQTLRNTEAIMDNLARAEVELVRDAEGRSSVSATASLALAPGAIDGLLTSREREVMALLVTGQTNSAIAERLVISEGTVKSHVKQILRKLGAVNRSEVIARYLGVIDD